MRRIDLTGQIFGKLTVISFDHTGKDGHSFWLCQCICGKRTIVAFSNLKQGVTLSCGCLRKAKLAAMSSTHGDSRAGKRKRLYRIWMGLRCRCNNTHSKDYNLYGGRGVTVCDAWNNYENFRNWALANNYKDNLSIDRIDPNGGYTPENCRWVINQVQANNKRNNMKITAFGETRTASEWGRLLGIQSPTIRLRIHHGVPHEEALSKLSKRTGNPLRT